MHAAGEDNPERQWYSFGMATSTQWKYLERDPLSSYMQLSVKGRRIKARTLYGMYVSEEDPRTIEQIAELRGVPAEAVREAVAYCESNPVEIGQDARFEEAIIEAAGMNEPGYKFHGKPRPISPQERARIRSRVYGDGE